MRAIKRSLSLACVAIGIGVTSQALAVPFTFSTGSPDGLLGSASRPGAAGQLEIESADDFTLGSTTSITSATFTGLLTSTATTSDISEIRIEIYRVFPNDSDVGRTSGPPTFSTDRVPTRVNSPSDVEIDDRDTATGGLQFTCGVVSDNFTVANSVVNGIDPKPNQTTGGEGPASGQEVTCSVSFTTPFLLAAAHYFFVPQVGLSTASANFLWLSAPRPVVAPGTPFPPGETDLQTWIRNENLAPDWLRIGTDIVGGTPAPTFDAAFSLTGETVPEPATCALLLAALAASTLTSTRAARASRARSA